MEKIKYIIIFTLTLGLGILYVQLLDYQKIASSLLQENANYTNKINNLQNEIELSTSNNIKLNNKIIFLEEALAIKKIQLNNLNFRAQNQFDTNNSENPIPLNLPPKELKKSPSDLKPNITLDNENQITGFGLEYQQTF